MDKEEVKETVEKWIKILGLEDLDIKIVFEGDEEEDGSGRKT